ncbi:MAG TPA: lipoyl(octanoyl) transferase [Bacteroidetes bacterium]|nr:lipoyl(octanoyl) transferase [Bacteroidota bacterium]
MEEEIENFIGVQEEKKFTRTVQVTDLGSIDFRSAWDEQEKIFSSLTENKMKNREQSEEEKIIPTHHFLFCEHFPVFTLGKSGSMKNLLVNQDTLNEKKISFFKINRGGDITFHGPGQIVGYPILDLDYFFTDIGKYLRLIEETIILTLADYGISAGRSSGETGVWIDAESPSRARKICAIGVRTSRWITMHGFAFNINTDLSYFDLIIPCGIQGKQVTSLQKELGREIDLNEVKEKILKHFAKLFDALLANH